MHRKAPKYLTEEVLKELPVTYVREIFMRDDLNLQEHEVYKLVQRYVYL